MTDSALKTAEIQIEDAEAASKLPIPMVTADKTPAEVRESILKLEAAMLALPKEEQFHIEPDHYFAPGIYMRELFIPAGVVITGKIHKTEHFCVVTMGRVRVVTEDGVKELQAGDIIKSMPGAKRCLVALENTVWLNVHHNPTNETDLEKIEEIFVTKSFEEFQAHQEAKQIEGGK